jgi:TetR/AcrR family transcriptional regulator, cholesterol catabolism regulator
MTTRKDLRQELRRKAIVEVAGEIFAEQGLEATTLDQVGAKLGLTKASIYYYYKSKDDLAVAVLRKALEEIDRKAALDMQGLDDPLQKLKARSLAHVIGATHTPSGKLIASNLGLLIDNEDAARLLACNEGHKKALLSEAKERGLIHDIDLTVATKVLYSALNGISRLCATEGISVEDVFESAWEIFLGGVRKR